MSSDRRLLLRVSVDPAVCESHGVCVRLAPEVFGFTGDGRLVIKQDLPSAELQGSVEDAVHRCPKQALALEVDSQ